MWNRLMVVVSCVLSWIASAVQLVAAEPGIEGERTYQAFELVRLQVSGLDARAKVIWRVSPMQNVHLADTKREQLQFSAPPGVYVVEALVFTLVGKDDFDARALTARVVIVDPPAPVPPAPVPPGPAPPNGNGIPAIGQPSLSGAFFTATPIAPQRPDGRYYLVTAAHCVPNVGAEGVYDSKAGVRYRVRVLAMDAGKDCAVLVTVNPQPPGLAVGKLADRSPPVGTAVWHAGYGVQNPGSKEPGKVTGLPASNSRRLLSCYLSVSSGDSGGAVVRADTGEIVGVVCCTAAKGRAAAMYCGSVETLQAQLRDVAGVAVAAGDDASDMRSASEPIEIPLLVADK